MTSLSREITKFWRSGLRFRHFNGPPFGDVLSRISLPVSMAPNGVDGDKEAAEQDALLALVVSMTLLGA